MQLTLVSVLIPLPAPDVTILMDNASFILSAPNEDLTPTVFGTPSPRMVPGKVGSALRLEGADLDYAPPNTECFYDVSLCTNGLSVSLWVKFYARTSNDQMIIDGGGYYPETRGMSIYITRTGQLGANVFIDNTANMRRALYEDLFHWQHIVFTWNVSIDIMLYINGCPSGRKLVQFSLPPKSQTSNFKIGGNRLGGPAQRGNIALDHVLMWYDVLTREEVWQLYIQGGHVWLAKMDVTIIIASFAVQYTELRKEKNHIYQMQTSNHFTRKAYHTVFC